MPSSPTASPAPRRSRRVSRRSTSSIPPELRALFDEASALAGLREVFHDEYGYAALRLLADTVGHGGARPGRRVRGRARDDPRRPPQLSLAVGRAPGARRVPELEPYRHWLEHQVALAAARLEPAAESAFAARTPTAAGAWGRLSQEILTSASIPFDAGEGEQPYGVVELRTLRLHADRDVRRRADEALLGIYEANLQVAAACLDAVIADRLTEDRLRAVTTIRWRRRSRSTRSTPQPSSCCSRRWRAAPTSSSAGSSASGPRSGSSRSSATTALLPSATLRSIPWPDAVDATCHVFEALSPSLGKIARGIFAENRVDAERRPGKDGAIFCAGFPPDQGVFVFVSYIESASGATMLGHEMGHAVHFVAAAAARPWLSAFEPETAAFFEVPSTFAELATAEHLYTTVGGDGGKALLRGALEGIFQLVFGAVGDDALRTGRVRPPRLRPVAHARAHRARCGALATRPCSAGSPVRSAS